MKVIPIVIGNNRMSGDDPNDRIKIGQNSPGDLRRLSVTQTQWMSITKGWCEKFSKKKRSYNNAHRKTWRKRENYRENVNRLEKPDKIMTLGESIFEQKLIIRMQQSRSWIVNDDAWLGRKDVPLGIVKETKIYPCKQMVNAETRKWYS